MKNPLRAFRARAGGEPELVASAAGAPGLAPDVEALLATVRRLGADQSPFGIPVLDCREFATSLLADAAEPISPATSDVTRSRHRKLPDDAVAVRCGLTYPHERPFADGVLFRARTMQDKWHVFHLDGRLVFARSWTGDPLFVAEYAPAPPVMTVKLVHASPGAFDGSTDLAVGMVDFLIKSHLFRVSVPHPLPAELPDLPALMATWSYNHFGRWGHYGAREDVTRLQLVSLDGRMVLRWTN
jgi:hypothetical protein